MNRFGMILSVVAFGSVTLAAQSPMPAPLGFGVVTGSTNVSAIPAPAGLACPVSMHALQRGSQNILVVREGPGKTTQQTHEAARRIHLVLGNVPNSAKASSVKVTVRGTSGKNRAMTTMVTPDQVSDRTRTFHFPVSLGKVESMSANLLLPGFTSVQSISLESVVYADGSIWNPPANGSCRIAPDPLVLVSAR